MISFYYCFITICVWY